MPDHSWGDFELPDLENLNEPKSVNLEKTPDIGSVVTNLRKRAMVVFFLIDISGSMRGARIGAVNDAIRNVLPEIKKREAGNTSAEIRVAILEFSSTATWRTPVPQPVSSFRYEDITQVGGGTNYSNAFRELNGKLSRNAFLDSVAGSFTPLIILLTDGKPSDPMLYKQELETLRRNAWFQYATKAGIAIEEGAMSQECRTALLEFTGNESMVFAARDIHVLAKQIQLVTVTGIEFVTKQGSLQNTAPLEDAAIAGFSSTGYVPPQPSAQSAPSSSGGSTAASPADTGVDPAIPGLDDIDWDAFPSFG